MNSYMYDSSFAAQQSQRPLAANEINNRVKRIQNGQTAGEHYNQYGSYGAGYVGGNYGSGSGSGFGGDGFSADGLGDLLLFILYALGGGDE